jgi:class 3 adenylate cyclase
MTKDRPTTAYLDAPDGVRIAYHVTGAGSMDLVWIAGIGYPFDLLWDEPGFEHLAKRLGAFSRTIWYEGRGFGASGGSYLDRFRETETTDLTGLLDACGCDAAAIVGFSHSGPWAIRYAASHPERVTSLILVDAYAHYVREADYAIGWSPQALDQMSVFLRENWGKGMSVALAPSKADDPAFRERIARYERLGIPPDQLAEADRLSCLSDVRALLPAVSVPTLVVTRQGPHYVSPEAGRYIAAHVPAAKYVDLPGADQLFFVGDVDALADEIEEFLTGSREGIEGDVMTATILFTDIVSSTEQSARMGHRRWSALSADHNAMVRAVLHRFRGREVKTVGDGFLATFDATSRAVRAAMEIVIGAKALGIDVRAGVHTGEIEVQRDDVAGLPVNIAKRICDLAGPGDVFVSRTVTEHVAGSGIAFVDRGEHDLKGVPDRWHLFAVAG